VVTLVTLVTTLKTLMFIAQVAPDTPLFVTTLERFCPGLGVESQGSERVIWLRE